MTFLSMEAIGEQGEVDLSVVRAIEDVNSGYTQFFDGDVVVAKITPCFENGKGALVSGVLGGVGFGTTELHVLTPGPVKRYQSEKTQSGDSWRHARIILAPANPEFAPIILTDADEGGLQLGERITFMVRR